MKGKIKWFNNTKRYGFIDGEDGESYFVHYSQLNNSKGYVNEGDPVIFDVATTDKGLQARNVTFQNE